MATPDDDAPRRKRKTNPVLLAFLGLLVVSLGGFSVTSFGGGRQVLGTVGDREILVQDYARALQQELNALGAQFGQSVSLAQALALGLDARVRGQLVAQAALDGEAARIGLSVGDARVAQEIAAMPAFRGPTGGFDRETYGFVLERNGLTEAAFEARLRDDIARSLLQGAVAAGFAAPQALTDRLYAYAGERRGFSLLRLTEADLAAPLPAPDAAALTAFHAANIAQFTRPEAPQVTYAALLPADLAADQPVDEAVLRRLYDERADEFNRPERRLVERLIYPTEAEALAARDRLDAGTDFAALVAERGLTVADIDLGDVALAELPPEAGAALFALAEPGIVGPFPTEFGPALFRMNGILAAEETPFEAARDTLAAELQADAARRAIADRREAIEDRLAEGATIAEIAAEEGMRSAQIALYPDSDDPLAGYPEFREAVAGLTAGDLAETVALDDGGLAVVQVDAVLPAAPIPFAEVRDRVAEAWRAAELARRLGERAVEIKAQVEAGASLGSFGIAEVTAALPRDGFVEDAPADFVAGLFRMRPGELRVVEAPGFTAVVRLDSVTPAAQGSDEAAAMKGAIAAQAAQALAQDAFTIFTSAITGQAGISLDQAAIAAVHAQFP
jgi:peptidyl-prolyl cis-trans isomerase D